jgi:hypothetical protein
VFFLSFNSLFVELYFSSELDLYTVLFCSIAQCIYFGVLVYSYYFIVANLFVHCVLICIARFAGRVDRTLGSDITGSRPVDLNRHA